MAIKYLNEVPDSEREQPLTHNPSKYLLWQDLMTGLFDGDLDADRALARRFPVTCHFPCTLLPWRSSIFQVSGYQQSAGSARVARPPFGSG